MAENPNTDREIFIKTYINLSEVILYLNENGNVIGFSSSITDVIGRSDINDVKKHKDIHLDNLNIYQAMIFMEM